MHQQLQVHMQRQQQQMLAAQAGVCMTAPNLTPAQTHVSTSALPQMQVPGAQYLMPMGRAEAAMATTQLSGVATSAALPLTWPQYLPP